MNKEVEHGAAPSAGVSNLGVRVISAVVLIGGVLAVTWVGGTAFTVLAAAISGAIFLEWTGMARGRGSAGHDVTAAVLLGLILITLLAGGGAMLIFAALAIAFLLCALDAWRRGEGPGTTTGLAYAALSGISLALLRGSDAEGLAAMLFLFATVWATDIAAYFAGRSLGGPKLAPSISPGKTWSGAIGGVIGGCVAGVVAAMAVGYWQLLAACGVALVLSVVSQIGDLFESRIKRHYGVKDSGWLIPGHGGVMDRVDGLVAAAFVLYVFGAWLGSADRPAYGIFLP